MVYSFPINLDKNDIVRKDKDFNTLTLSTGTQPFFALTFSCSFGILAIHYVKIKLLKMVTSKHIALDGISKTIETQYRPQ